MFLILSVAISSFPRPVAAQLSLLQRPTAYQGARVLTMDGREIDSGVLVVAGDKIRAVGTQVKLPPLTKKIDVNGTTITPGLIDVASVLGRVGPRETSGGNATRRAEDAFDRYDTANIEEALQQGITALFLSPAGPAGICGTGAVIRLSGTDGGPRGSILKSEAALCIDLSSAAKPIARLKTLQAIEKALQGAQQYRQSLEAYEEEVAEYVKQLEEQANKKKSAGGKPSPKEEPPDGAADDGGEPKKEPEPSKAPPSGSSDSGPKKPRRPARNLVNELLLKALDREIPVRFIADRSSDLLNALELADEFSLDVILEGAAESYLLTDQIAAAKAGVVLGRMDVPFERREAQQPRRSPQPGGCLTEAGIDWVVGSGAAGAQRTRFILFNAQMAVADDESTDPVELVTARAADMLQVRSIGRLQAGSYADFVVWSGDPLDPATRVLKVIVGGKEVYAAGE